MLTNLCLALTMSAFKTMTEYDAQICEFEAKPVADKTFAYFRPFTVNEYAKCMEQHKSITKSTIKFIDLGIARLIITTAAANAGA